MIQRRSNRSSGNSASGQLMGRLLIGLVIVGFSLFSYFGSSEYNDVTGENQYLSLTVEQEISLGRQSTPELIQEFGGLSNDRELQALITQIGTRLVRESIAYNTPWQWQFHVLADRQTINAFALPGGQVFITTAMLNQLSTEDEIAGVLAHEIVHVLARHSAQRIAQSNLTNGIIGAVSVASGDASAAQTAQMIGQIINMSYGRDDELQSDTIGVCLMIDAGYNPQGMIGVMQVLAQLGGSQPEFFSTHPNPNNRITQIENAIANADTNCRYRN
jgi:predicted Zn-dependent protease